MKLYHSLTLAAGIGQVAVLAHLQTGLYLRSYAPQIMAKFLDDDADLVDDIVSHGCHCAKLDNANPFLEHLGGSTVVDELDEICRDWLRARNCNDNLTGGSCASDRESMRDGDYTLDIVTEDYQNSACGFTRTDCAEDTCEIDLLYLKMINQFIADNPSFSATNVESGGTCTQAFLDKRERKCIGEAPDVSPKRMSDLEQLFDRIDWVVDRFPEDEVLYNEGGPIQLNDAGEFIDLYAKNQLITFNWPNVKSFTVETTDAFNLYYVGWTERATVDNFQTGEVLGDDTKGGYKTSGIYSGDGKIRAHGMDMDADPPGNFFDGGNTVTCTRNGSDLEYYLDGVLVGTIDASEWNGVYPAVDTNDRYHIRILDVIYEDAETDPVDISG